MEMHRLALLAQPQVEDLDKNREGHREVDVPLRNVLSSPSATSVMPIRSRKLNARIFTVGWRLTKSASGLAATSIMPIEMTTATTAIVMLVVMPIAVITESSEKTISSSTIWIITLEKETVSGAGFTYMLFPFQLGVNLGRRLVDQEETAEEKNQIPAVERMAGNPE